MSAEEVFYTAAEQAHRERIRIFKPDAGEWELDYRMRIAEVRDKAASGMARCSDPVYPILAAVARQATEAVYAHMPGKRLMYLSFALANALDAARILEKAQRIKDQ